MRTLGKAQSRQTRALKRAHRAHVASCNAPFSLREFAREVADHPHPSRLRDYARGWLDRKRGRP